MDAATLKAAMPEPITTGRLVLRRPVYADVPAITALANNKKISDMLSALPHPYTSEDAIAFLENRARADTEHAYAVTRADGLLIGMCGVILRPGQPPEIGYWLGEDHWGRGYAAEAAGALVEAVFATGSVDEIMARTLAVNAASARVLDKLGFVLTDERVDDCGQHQGVRVKFFTLEAAQQRRRAV